MQYWFSFISMDYIWALLSYAILTYIYEGFGIYNNVWKYKTRFLEILSFVGLFWIYAGVCIVVDLLATFVFPFFLAGAVIMIIAAMIHGFCGVLNDYYGNNGNFFETLNLSKKEDMCLYLARSTPGILILFMNNIVGFVVGIVTIGIFSVIFIKWSYVRKESLNG